ncbi:hypothetical protein DSO57_1019116 [Entomophthora muscae]|uniref:Uncharacterized protein n=1 Tax=Entomophthora muscae TaxID=34485 RepID=A0ACC2UP77_9FUNG|nr:hypothetical protein DSO57_1019116 [Entomophthora muscae]
MKLLLAHKNLSLSHLLDGGIVPRAKAEGNIMVTAAPVCRSNLIPPLKLTLINSRNLRVTRYELVNQHGHQKLVTQGFFATWTKYSLDNVEGIGAQDLGGIA